MALMCPNGTHGPLLHTEYNVNVRHCRNSVLTKILPDVQGGVLLCEHASHRTWPVGWKYGKSPQETMLMAAISTWLQR